MEILAIIHVGEKKQQRYLDNFENGFAQFSSPRSYILNKEAFTDLLMKFLIVFFMSCILPIET
ncbi:hypothetical protein VCR15J2_40028 [Vibrio coralliirubri]|nr:hypothetical protein VCR15J2_40028 [Vibrio coralliirubri]